jgi:hypothetical protein
VIELLIWNVGSRAEQYSCVLRSVIAAGSLYVTWWATGIARMAAGKRISTNLYKKEEAPAGAGRQCEHQ